MTDSRKRLETLHSMKRRTPWHDYHWQGTYMLTLVVNEHMPLFGELKGKVANYSESIAGAGKIKKDGLKITGKSK